VETDVKTMRVNL